MRSWLVFALALGPGWPATGAAQEAGGLDVVAGYRSKRVHHQEPKSIDIERQVIRGRVHKPHLVFEVEKRRFRFEVGTSRYSWRAEERQRAGRPAR